MHDITSVDQTTDIWTSRVTQALARTTHFTNADRVYSTDVLETVQVVTMAFVILNRLKIPFELPNKTKQTSRVSHDEAGNAVLEGKFQFINEHSFINHDKISRVYFLYLYYTRNRQLTYNHIIYHCLQYFGQGFMRNGEC